MNNFHSLYSNMIKENKVSLINEQNVVNELKIRLIMEGITPNEEDLKEISKACIELYEAKWWKHGLAHIAGAIDPTGVVDMGHAIYYFNDGQILSGILTLLGAIPYLGDTAKILIPVFKGTKLGQPVLRSGLAAGFKLSNAKVSAAKFLLQRMPSIQKGLAWLVSKMVKSPAMRRVLIKIFGKGDLTKKIVSQSRNVYRNMRPVKSVVRGPRGRYMTSTTPGSTLADAAVDSTKIVEHIVKKMLSMIDKPLRMLAGPKMYTSPLGAVGASTAKGLAYNADFSEIPSLQKYSTAPKDKEFDNEVSAMRKFINDNPYSPTSPPRHITAPTKKKSSIDLGSL